MNEQWYWDLKDKRAVQASERGPASETLGPYPTKEAAENWRETAAEHNEEWDLEDEEWNSWGEDGDEQAESHSGSKDS